MFDEPSFLASVCESRDDDTPRLVYADWLEEHGDALRAEFIRVQCELDAAPWYAKNRLELEKRELALLRKHKSNWLGSYESLVRNARFERGFVESVNVSPAQFLEHSIEIFERAPLRKVNFLQVSDKSAPEIGANETLANISQLVVNGSMLTEPGWQAILGSPHLTSLVDLEWRYDSEKVSALQVIDALSTCPNLSNIRQLDGWFDLDDAEAQAAFQSLPIHSMESLRFFYPETNVFLLLQSLSCFANLKHIEVFGQGSPLAAIAKGLQQSAEKLRHLSLTSGDWNDLDVRALVRSGHFKNLEILDLENNQISDDGFCELVTGLPKLKTLLLADNPIQGRNLDALESCDHPAPLESLVVKRYDRFSSSGIDVIGDRFALKKFKMGGSRLSDGSLVNFLSHSNREELRHLDLNDNKLTDRTAKRIIESPYLDDLMFLSLKENEISVGMKKELRRKYGPGVCTFTR